MSSVSIMDVGYAMCRSHLVIKEGGMSDHRQVRTRADGEEGV